MTENAENKVETLPDLDDLLQCPVCYEIPSGQIFQCNEGHHVCGRCKMRLDVCPVCRAFFFGTRNYAMEELIANVRKLRAFKLGGKVTTGSPPAEVTTDTRESSSEENESTHENVNDEDDDDSGSVQTTVRPPTACKGLFRCLCCKNNPERLPLARLLNHLRYYHSPDLIEGRSDNGVYLQAWQFPTAPGRMVTAVRVHDMGIFFLVIEVTHETVHAWMSMAASPWVAQQFSYSFTLSGNDREAIFSDCVWSVRACEGSLKRRERCLAAAGADARALLAPAAMSGKLSVRRTPRELQPAAAQPRAVLRVANRSHPTAEPPTADRDVAHDLEPFLQDLQNDVARLSRAFATLGREANALVRSEAEMRARLESVPAPPAPDSEALGLSLGSHLSRSARRRQRQRMREAFRETVTEPTTAAAGDARNDTRAAVSAPRPNPNRIADDTARSSRAQPAAEVARPALNNNRPQNNQVAGNAARVSNGQPTVNARANNNANVGVTARANNSQNSGVARATSGQAASNANRPNQRMASPPLVVYTGYAVVSEPDPPVAPPPVAPPTFGGPSQGRSTNGNTRNKKKRRQRK